MICVEDICSTLTRYGIAVPDPLRAEVAALLQGPPARGIGLATWTSDLAPVADAAELLQDLALPPRYDLRFVIGHGGMGRVLHVRDAVLHRDVAMKVARRDLSPVAQSRFVVEAQATAHLEHPGIVPVYDLGNLPSGEPYYTMPLIRGRTLTADILDLHAASTPEHWGTGAHGTTLHRVLSRFQSMCEAVSYAHARGVIHRDLKPDNVMLADFGVTLVLDWGLAKVLEDDGSQDGACTDVRTAHMRSNMTMHGTVVGTPGYLAPEQARGDSAAMDARVDVHALGACLYEILVGRPPFTAATRFDALLSVLQNEAELPGAGAAKRPEELVELCEACLRKDPEERPRDASVVAGIVAEWTEGARRLRRGEAELTVAESIDEEILRLIASARDLDRRAADQEAAFVPWTPTDQKVSAWRLRDRGAAARDRAELLRARRVHTLQVALRFAPDLTAARVKLSQHFHAEHEQAEARGDSRAAAAAEIQLMTHDQGRYADYLRGRGELTVVTDPPGAEIAVFQFEERDRRLVPCPSCRLGLSPIERAELPIGSYLLRISHPERAPLRVPVRIDRNGHWNGAPLGVSEPLPLVLPGLDDLGPGDVLVPAGPFLTGGDPEATSPRPRAEMWLDSFVIRRHPVTNAEYAAFLERPQSFEPSHSPVVRVSWDEACAYASFLAEQTGLPWRLPWEAEWEKAARGVDGRVYPWGHFADPTWLANRHSRSRPRLAAIDDYQLDVGPYGVLGQGGNVRDWCLDVHGSSAMRRPGDVQRQVHATTRRSLRGGEWSGDLRRARSASRAGAPQSTREPTIGFRLVRGFGAPFIGIDR